MALTLRVRPGPASRVGSGKSDEGGAETIIKQRGKKETWNIRSLPGNTLTALLVAKIRRMLHLTSIMTLLGRWNKKQALKKEWGKSNGDFA